MFGMILGLKMEVKIHGFFYKIIIKTHP